MRPSKWMLAIGLCVLGAGGSAPAAAQAARLGSSLARLMDRPSLGPSMYIGGSFTQNPPLMATRQTTALLAPTQAQFRARGRGQMSRYAAAMMPELGMHLGGSSSVFTGPTRPDPAALPGLTPVRELHLPVPNVPIGYVPALTASQYTPRPATTPFQDLCGLLPPPEEQVQMLASAPERLNVHIDDRLTRARAEALEFFKNGTRESRGPQLRYENCEDCGAQLSSAVARLRLVRDLDRADALVVLLMMHGSLEQERPTRATQELLQAFRRAGGALFDDARELDRYFGDAAAAADGTLRSAYLAEQMRRYSRIGTSNPDSPDAFAMQAYCAWRLGEPTETREALQQLELLAARNPAESEELLLYVETLRDVLDGRRADAGAGQGP